MKGTLRQFDPEARVLSKLVLFVIMLIFELFHSAVSWSLVTYDIDGNPVAMGATNDTAHPFNIYRDVKAVPETRQFPLSNGDINSSGWYRIDNVTAVPIAVLGLHDWDDVDTDINFTQAEPVSSCRTSSALLMASQDNAWRQPLFAYPFDQWSGNIVLAATDLLAAQEVGLVNTAVVELSNATLADSTCGFSVHFPCNIGLIPCSELEDEHPAQ
jgi:hypothetical protein